MGSKTFTEFEEKKNVTETIGDQAASLLGPLINQKINKYDPFNVHVFPVLCPRTSTSGLFSAPTNM